MSTRKTSEGWVVKPLGENGVPIADWAQKGIVLHEEVE